MARKRSKIAREAELADEIRGANGPLSIRGGGTRGFDGAGAPLEVSGLSGITLYEPGALTLVAQAGTPVSEIETALAKENQRLAFEPMDARALQGRDGTPTIGGVFASNASGSRRISVGAARDFLLGVRFVDGQGQIVKNGGRVMKNVTGYDLVKLMAGSYGTLGVLTEVSLKVLPRPETQATLVLSGLSDMDAVAAMSKAMGSPFEVTGAAHDPAQGQTLLRVEGFAGSVNYRIEELQTLLGLPQMDVMDAGVSTTRWAQVRDASVFAGTGGDIWRLSCKPSDGPALAAKAAAERHFYDWAGGLLWLEMASGTDLRARLGSFGGHATLLRAKMQTKADLGVFQPETAGVAKLSAGLRARFDPKGIFNAGLMGGAG